MNHQEFQQRPTVDRLRSVIQSLRNRLSELEHQNQQLRQSQTLSNDPLDSYSDLYDFAPVGSITMDFAGTLRDVSND